MTTPQWMHDAVLQPLIDHMKIADAFRFRRTCRAIHDRITDTLYETVARDVVRCRWKRVSNSVTGSVRQVRTSAVTYSEAKDTIVRSETRTYKSCVPSRDDVIQNLQRKLCRECLRPCKIFAVCVSGRHVVLCPTCWDDETSYSSLCDRITARKQLKGRVKNVERAIRSLHVAKRSRSGSFLFWRYQVLSLAK